MKKLTITEQQAFEIEKTLESVAKLLASKKKTTPIDVSIIQSWKTIRSVIFGEI